ncbi:hypothetical protein Salat_0608900 [Sesamum alatum]|uniref:Uncharacterized protein n=1 Tax=Sesamum alatum TaxID=300844 RepID=A0AAE1YR13_9LAMI|nr:hypothetical protein Salat_0608900 [Sesamum alatum]
MGRGSEPRSQQGVFCRVTPPTGRAPTSHSPPCSRGGCDTDIFGVFVADTGALDDHANTAKADTPRNSDRAEPRAMEQGVVWHVMGDTEVTDSESFIPETAPGLGSEHRLEGTIDGGNERGQVRQVGQEVEHGPDRLIDMVPGSENT